MFRAVARLGKLSDTGLHVNSPVPLLRALFDAAVIAFAEQYSGHSLRRGLATWATLNDRDLKTLMEYVGSRDVDSAMCYVDVTDPFERM